MSVGARRMLSWLVTAAALAAIVIAAARLPGHGGLHAELRWLLSRPATPQTLNQALGLSLLAYERQPSTSREVWARLLRDDNPQVVRNALTVIGDKLRSDLRGQHAETADVRDTLRAWLQETADPNVPPSAAAVFDDVFGPAWRCRFESGGAASQPGNRDRGG